jgi:hypothetical protein
LIIKDDDPLTISSPPIPWCEGDGCQPVVDHDDDLGDIQTFKKAVSWLVNTYPAEKYAVIFWGHGAGWREEEEAPIFKGMDPSERTGRRLTTQDLGESVRFFSSLLNRPVDLVVFDSCFMQMTEIAAEIGQSGSFMVGSQDRVPPAGLPYVQILQGLDPTSDALSLGKLMVSQFNDFYKTIAVTMSLIELSRLQETKDRFRQFVTKFTSDSNNRTQLKLAYNKTQKFRFADYVDVIDLLDQLSELAPAGGYNDQLHGLIDALKNVVLLSKAQGPMNKGALGISAYFPQPYMFDSSYTNLKFAGVDFGWLELIKWYTQTDVADLIERYEVLARASPELLRVSPARFALEKTRLDEHLTVAFKNSDHITQNVLLQRAQRFDLTSQFKPANSLVETLKSSKQGLRDR